MKRKCKLKLIIVLFLMVIGVSYVLATPVAPTITTVSNSTQSSASGTVFNSTPMGSTNPHKAGGYIYTVNLEAFSQNNRWKAYVGNVTGSFVLDDAAGFTIYDWSIAGTISGEVYATRASTSISWANINCSTRANISVEEAALLHTTNPADNISRTFNDTDNQQFYVGNVDIDAGTCYSTNTYINDTANNPNDNFEEILLHDKNNMIYATIMEDDADGYRTNATNNVTYDFQMILPERGTDGWASSTAYYFFVELT